MRSFLIVYILPSYHPVTDWGLYYLYAWIYRLTEKTIVVILTLQTGWTQKSEVDILLHNLFLDWSISSGPWKPYRSVCSPWSMGTTCSPPLRTCSRRASWCGPSAGSTSTPLSAYLSTLSSASSSLWSPTPMTPSRWGEYNHLWTRWSHIEIP